MKKIIIYQENANPIILYDNDESNIEDYKKNFYKIFDSTKIIDIETDNKQCLISRPSKLNSIYIEEVILDSNEKHVEFHNEKNEINEPKKDEEENFIVDGE